MIEFDSRKNKVVLLDDNTVVKTFCNYSCYENEVATLKLLQGNFAPVFISASECNIKMGFIQGKLLSDIYTSCCPQVAKTLGGMLSNTVSALRAVLKDKITFDENFRNYIVTKNSIVRVDFEETTLGTMDEWCAKLMAFATMYCTPLDVKLSFITALIKQNQCHTALLKLYQNELIFLAQRWSEPFPQTHFNKICSLFTTL